MRGAGTVLRVQTCKVSPIAFLVGAFLKKRVDYGHGFLSVFLLVGAFEEKCPTLTVGSFFRRVRSTFLFICSTT